MSQISKTCFFILSGILVVSGLVACGTSQSASTPTAALATLAVVQPTNAPSTAPANTTAAPTSVPSSAPVSTTVAATNAPVSASDATASKKFNLNTATAEQILTIPNTGNRMVREFQEYRPYTSILQFRREIGKYVDEQTVAAYENYVYVPIDSNSSDAATLQQIPGLDESEAAALVAARPFESNDAFLSALSQDISAEELAVAQTYLVDG